MRATTTSSLTARSQNATSSRRRKSVKEIAEFWYKRKNDAGSYRYGTLHNWRTHIDKYIVPSLGEIAIQEVTIQAVENAAAEWAEMTSVNTANKVLTTLTAIFKLVQRYGPIEGKANVAEIAERLKVSNDDDEDHEVRPDEVYCGEELQKLIEATPNS